METLIIILVLLAATRIGASVAQHLGLPTLAGEIAAGVVIGLSIQYWSGTPDFLLGLGDDTHLQVLNELGIFFLMLLGGIELKPAELLSVSFPAVVVAFCAMALPFGGGILLAWHWLPESDARLTQALFVGVALAVTAVPVSVRVLMDMGCLHTRLGNLIVAAAVMDDLFSLVLLSVLTAMIRTGQMPGGQELWLLFGNIAVFLILVVAVDRLLIPRLWRWISESPLEEARLSMLIILSAVFALVAHHLGLHFIMGAFAAGLVMQSELIGEPGYEEIHTKVAAITKGLLAPIFFASIGMELNLAVVTAVPGFLAALLAIAVLGKLIGAAVPARLLGFDGRSATAAGIAMTARGAVELVIAGIALNAGLFAMGTEGNAVTENLFSAIVLVAVVTTILAPLGLRFVLGRRPVSGA